MIMFQKALLYVIKSKTSFLSEINILIMFEKVNETINLRYAKKQSKTTNLMRVPRFESRPMNHKDKVIFVLLFSKQNTLSSSFKC